LSGPAPPNGLLYVYLPTKPSWISLAKEWIAQSWIGKDGYGYATWATAAPYHDAAILDVFFPGNLLYEEGSDVSPVEWLPGLARVAVPEALFPLRWSDWVTASGLTEDEVHAVALRAVDAGINPASYRVTLEGVSLHNWIYVEVLGDGGQWEPYFDSESGLSDWIREMEQRDDSDQPDDEDEWWFDD